MSENYNCKISFDGYVWWEVLPQAEVIKIRECGPAQILEMKEPETVNTQYTRASKTSPRRRRY